MEELLIADRRLKAARADYEREYEAIVTKLADKGNSLNERLNKLDEKKLKIAETCGNAGATEDDLIEINAGGKIVAAKRSTLTQVKGTRFEALFSGRWDNELQRDGHGRIFLDVNPVGFRAIVDYLNEMSISSEDNPPNPPSVDDEHKHILQHQLELFGLSDAGPMPEMSDSNIIKDEGHVTQLHDWLKEDGSDGEFILLYRSSRDGKGAAAFHSKCDSKGSTLIVIETTDGLVVGGYSNAPWTSSSGTYHVANKAFLFVLTGNGIASPCKMKLKDDNYAVWHASSHGPVFGTGVDLIDLYVQDSNVYLKFGHSYESGPSQLDNNGSYKKLAIKEMEVFQVSGSSSRTGIAITKEKQIQPQIPRVEPVTIFTEAINDAINAKQESLLRAEAEITNLEDSFEGEGHFITAFSSGHAKDVILLNVSGATMATKRSTLQTAEDSVLAQQFDDSKWTEQGCNGIRVDDWTSEDVCTWANNIKGIQEDAGRILKEHKINGSELLALNMEGLKMIGVKRAGTSCLLLRETKRLKRASLDAVTFIEHSPYCFGKIFDYLRLKQIHSLGLAGEPSLPKVCNSQKSRFEKVVKYYFPGDSAKFILG